MMTEAFLEPAGPRDDPKLPSAACHTSTMTGGSKTIPMAKSHRMVMMGFFFQI